MTDGLIQEAIQKEINWHIAHNNEIVINALVNIQRELIKKIKQHQFDSDKYFDDTIKEVLIGDNQE